eukprot:CAMPEP_0179446642 /NCGR_PEP_ID=MMETSP0799-20121207/30123_1 /TAXON_ID=46947 /ORGANISM="Geminigera cryophila, Strain CCMP2564" /LENGTH=142 /DNA_ID=CAMNT_0021235959 /DNA_START=232 /DNA_END=660 /DNA_ORIENTATION=-
MATTTPEERAQAAKMRSGESGGGGAGLMLDPTRFPPVEIEMGTQKYVLIKLLIEPTQYLVRGNCDAEYHKDAAHATVQRLQQDSIGYDVLGGGRIQADAKAIKIFGFSYGFPWNGSARHDIAAELIKWAYPDAAVETSSDGY